MAQFTTFLLPSEILHGLADDDEEMGEVIARVAFHVSQLDDEDLEALRDYIAMHASASVLRVTASVLVQVANEMEA